MIAEAQRRETGTWSALLMLAYFPGLLGIRSTMKPSAGLGADELNALLVESFLETVGALPLATQGKLAVVNLILGTRKAAWQRLARETARAEREEPLPEHADDLFASHYPSPERIALAREAERLLEPERIRDWVEDLLRDETEDDLLLPEEWKAAATQQRLIVQEAIEKSRDLLPRFAVFSLAPIPLAAHLGFLFSDRVEVRAFQYDRDRSEWSWPSDGDEHEDVQIDTSGVPDDVVTQPCEVGLRLSISARVSESDARAGAPDATHHIEIHVPSPNKMWLSSTARLRAAAKQVRDTLAAIRDRFPECTRGHVFAAVPPITIALGQAVNPRMDPSVALYEYARQRSPRYRFALALEEGA